ncbi:FkbM family methyltransferase [Hydrogenophaga sp. 5NK40-0174]|uniref:FkbM family methyltransferase n=1 Tax=Hydrogenophaga sp. 5NK40-0174 TaxID=3127649 RepID=UPI00310A924C
MTGGQRKVVGKVDLTRHGSKGAGKPRAFSVRMQSTGGVNYLVHNGPDLINQHLGAGRVWEPATLQLASMLLQRVRMPVVLDIGANMGAFAVPVGKWLGARGGRLLAFEPQKMVFFQLCANLFANGLTHCDARRLAVGEAVGQIELPVLDVGSHANLGSLSLDREIQGFKGRLPLQSSQVETVQMTSIDALDLPRVDLIKIDVEGLEFEVLKGARQTIERSDFPHLVFEVWGDSVPQYRPKREALLEFVENGLGYEVTRLGELCVAQHPRRREFDVVRNADKTITFKPVQRPVAED